MPIIPGQNQITSIQAGLSTFNGDSILPFEVVSPGIAGFGILVGFACELQNNSITNRNQYDFKYLWSADNIHNQATPDTFTVALKFGGVVIFQSDFMAGPVAYQEYFNNPVGFRVQYEFPLNTLTSLLAKYGNGTYTVNVSSQFTYFDYKNNVPTNLKTSFSQDAVSFTYDDGLSHLDATDLTTINNLINSLQNQINKCCASNATQPGFTQPACGATVNVALSPITDFQVNEIIFIPVGGYYQIVAISNGIATIKNLCSPGGATANTSIPPSSVQISGPQGPQGATGPSGATGATGATGPSGPSSSAGKSLTSVTPSGTRVPDPTLIDQAFTGLADTSGFQTDLNNANADHGMFAYYIVGNPGNPYFIFKLDSVNSSSSIHISAQCIPGIQPTGTVVPANTPILRLPRTVISSFTVPNIGATAQATVTSTANFSAGSFIFIAFTGASSIYQIVSIDNGTQMTVKNLGNSGNINCGGSFTGDAPGTVFTANSASFYQYT